MTSSILYRLPSRGKRLSVITSEVIQRTSIACYLASACLLHESSHAWDTSLEFQSAFEHDVLNSWSLNATPPSSLFGLAIIISKWLMRTCLFSTAHIHYNVIKARRSVDGNFVLYLQTNTITTGYDFITFYNVFGNILSFTRSNMHTDACIRPSKNIHFSYR